MIYHVVTGKYEVMENGKILPRKKSEFKTKNKRNIPQNWDCVRLKDVAELRAGGTPPSTNKDYYDYEGGGYNWIQVCDLKNRALTETNKKVSEKGKEFTKTLPANSVVLAMYASVGKTAKTSEPMELNQAVLGITPKTSAEKDWIFEALTVQEEETKNTGRGGTQNNVNAQICGNICMPWPPSEEAARILAFLQKLEDETSKIKNQWEEGVLFARVNKNRVETAVTAAKKKVEDIKAKRN